MEIKVQINKTVSISNINKEFCDESCSHLDMNLMRCRLFEDDLFHKHLQPKSIFKRCNECLRKTEGEEYDRKAT